MAQLTSIYKRTLTASDFIATGTTITCPAGAYVEIASYKVPPKQVIAFGNGRINNGVEDRGKYYINISTSAPANIPGVARLILKDANRLNSQFVREDLSADIASSSVYERMGVGGTTGLVKNPLSVSEDELLILEYKATSAATATYANCSLNIPVTIWTFK